MSKVEGEKKWEKDSTSWFRSKDLWVMSPTRFLCAKVLLPTTIFSNTTTKFCPHAHTSTNTFTQCHASHTPLAHKPYPTQHCHSSQPKHDSKHSILNLRIHVSHLGFQIFCSRHKPGQVSLAVQSRTEACTQTQRAGMCGLST